MTAGAAGPGWDEVIVGAGSAGAVVASRLSERSGRRVLLLEAGVAEVDTVRAPHLRGAPVLDGYNWDYSAYVGTEAGQRTFPYRMGKVVGGSSAVNGAIALRGLAPDFGRWAAAGNPEWAWDRVRPYFTRIEADADFGGRAGHGTDGPLPIRRLPPADYDPVARAFAAACQGLGLPQLPDLNRGPDAGVGPVPTNTRDGRRMSVAEAYLRPVSGRPNLSVWDRCQVIRVILTGPRAVGVELIRAGHRMTVAAGRVTLSAGAVNTPLILHRSGIGPAARLKAAGLRVVADVPGVGENLADHPVMAVWSVRNDGGRGAVTSEQSVMARIATAPGDPDVSLTLASNARVPNMPGIGRILGDRIGVSVSAMQLSPRSRGHVFLRDASPGAKPVIELRLASEPADVRLLMDGIRLAWRLVRSSPVRDLLRQPFIWTDRLVGDDKLLRQAVPKFVSPMWHPAGTARMGPASDPMAVVDQYCRVHPVAGLHVVDASVMPCLPSAMPNLTCIMLAERAAEWMDQPPSR